MQFMIRELGTKDAEQVAELEQAIFSDAWSAAGVADTIQLPYGRVTGCLNENLLGYLIVYFIADTCEIMRIGVSASCRKQGIAQKLMDDLLLECARRGVSEILLDVRESNEPAIAFYKKQGFTEDGRRKDYYENPTETAILMSMPVKRV